MKRSKWRGFSSLFFLSDPPQIDMAENAEVLLCSITMVVYTPSMKVLSSSCSKILVNVGNLKIESLTIFQDGTPVVVQSLLHYQ